MVFVVMMWGRGVYVRVIVVGFVMCLVGDVLFEFCVYFLMFIVGMIVFFIGYFCYVIVFIC